MAHLAGLQNRLIHVVLQIGQKFRSYLRHLFWFSNQLLDSVHFTSSKVSNIIQSFTWLKWIFLSGHSAYYMYMFFYLLSSEGTARKYLSHVQNPKPQLYKTEMLTTCTNQSERVLNPYCFWPLLLSGCVCLFAGDTASDYLSCERVSDIRFPEPPEPELIELEMSGSGAKVSNCPHVLAVGCNTWDDVYRKKQVRIETYTFLPPNPCGKTSHSTKKPVTTMLTYPWKCTVLHCNHLGNTWKPLVLMTQHFDYHPR